MKILNEALESGLYENRGMPFTKTEFDIWFANYNVITEMPCYMAPQFVAAYPDAQYLLVERNPEDLVTSWKATIFQFADALDRFTMSLLKHFDPMLSEIDTFCKAILPAVTYGKGTTPEGELALRDYYVNYLTKVKCLVPSNKLHVVRLGDALDWEHLCSLLGEGIPSLPWPIKHSPAEFKVVMGAPLAPGARKAMIKVASLALALVGAFAWWTWW
ncbi:putative P-loop containing nucleoside triphosphate hydrolase protein [Seiridium cardinale]|uniref:P-loop containing nucleoside triphosphate hydrolase protein n=1 Tax=Seiridium cardinale TaxID=138064 RepID=A0ABR2X8Q3_9PEZI